MDLRSQTALLAAIVTLALAVSMLLRAPRQRVLTLYSALCFGLFAYYLGDFLSAVTHAGQPLSIRDTSVWSRASILFGGLVPVTALAFFTEFLGFSPRSALRARIGGTLGALISLVVALSPLAGEPVARILVAVWVFAALLVNFSTLLKRLTSTESRIERARLRYLAIGAGIAIFFSALDMLPYAGIRVPPTGAVIVTLYMYFLAQTLQRLRLLDLHELLGKTAALTVLACVLVAIYAVLVYWVGERFGLFLFNTLVASFVIVILFEPLRAKVEELVVATLFRERFEMIRVLTGLTSRMGNVIEVGDLARLVLDTLNETRRVTHSSIYLLADDRPGFWLLDHRGPTPTPFLDAAAARGLLAAAVSGQKAVLRENVERRIAELRVMEQAESRKVRDEVKKLNDLKAALGQMHAGIAVPLLGADRVIGFLNLWDERVPESYASDEIALVLEVAERVATVVENSKLYERMKERDRLAALGEMAAGLAHEIRNPLGAIKGAAQCLTPQGMAEENAELLSVIVDEVNRLNTVVTQFLDYSRPLKQNFAPTDMRDVVNRTLMLLEKALPPHVQVKTEVGEKLNKVQADAEQIKQVLINLVQNAVQAMPEGGTLTIALRMPEDVPAWRFNAQPEVIELRVRDTGKGMTAETRQHIFVPFYTTKEKGTGLGLAISQRIVKNHGGTIGVSSKVGEGTEFVIRLPSIPEPRQQELPLDGTPSPDLTPFPGTLAPPPALAPAVEQKPKREKAEKKRRRAGT